MNKLEEVRKYFIEPPQATIVKWYDIRCWFISYRCQKSGKIKIDCLITSQTFPELLNRKFCKLEFFNFDVIILVTILFFLINNLMEIITDSNTLRNLIIFCILIFFSVSVYIMKNKIRNYLTNKFKESKEHISNMGIWNNLLYKFIFMSLLSIITCFFITWCSFLNFLDEPEILAVIIVAFPTLIVWLSDIQTKNNEMNLSDAQYYLDVQNTLENKFKDVLKRTQEIHKTEIDEANISEFNDVIIDVRNFIKTAKSFSMYKRFLIINYFIDFIQLYSALDRIRYKVNNSQVLDLDIKDLFEDLEKSIHKLQMEVLKIIELNTPNDELIEFPYGYVSFVDIDFTELPKIVESKLIQSSSSLTITFKNCKFNYNKFPFMSKDNEGELDFNFDKNCVIIQNNKTIKLNEATEKFISELEEKYNIKII